MMSTIQKLEALKSAYDEEELGQIVDKLLDEALNQQRTRLERYDAALRDFEQRYEISSYQLHRRFEAGELGDKMDFFEWASLYELKQETEEQVKRLEGAR